jgi:hypothetical protein
MTTHLVVNCKNTPFHRPINPHHGHTIRVPERLPDKSRPAADRFQVTCDLCGKTYWYRPEDVLKEENEEGGKR